jgi:predicted dehydrogenase
VVQWLKERQAQLGRVNHYYYRLFAGDPGRYRDWGVEWMLDPAQAGAGPLFNFGPHVVDLFLHLATERVERVSAQWTHGLHGETIEDLCSITMVGADGAVGVGEVSYTMPEGYERYFSFDSEALHCGGADMGDMPVVWRDGRSEQVTGNDFSNVYFAYTKDCLERFKAGQPPVAGIDDMVKTLRVMNAARESAMSGETVKLARD